MEFDQKTKDVYRGMAVVIEDTDGIEVKGVVTMYDDKSADTEPGLWLRSDGETAFIPFSSIKDMRLADRAEPAPAEPMADVQPMEWKPRVEERTHKKLHVKTMSAPAVIFWVSVAIFAIVTVLGIMNGIVYTILLCFMVGAALTWLIRRMEHK